MIGRMDYPHKHINSVKQYYRHGQNELGYRANVEKKIINWKVLVIFVRI